MKPLRTFQPLEILAMLTIAAGLFAIAFVLAHKFNLWPFHTVNLPP